MAERKEQEERIKELTDTLEKGIQLVFNSDDYKDYLKTMSRFHQYSYNNAMLIHLQAPDASYVAGYRTWQTMDRQVKKGEKGITILAPCPYTKQREVEVVDPATHELKRDEDGNPVREMKEFKYTGFKTTTVFDIGQTEGKELPEIAPELKGEVADYDTLMKAIENVSPVPVRFEDWSDEKKGYYDLANKEIVIKAGMSQEQTLKTAIHELTHSILHSDTDHTKDPRTMETEAESTAFVVCSSLNIDTSDYSFGYLASWASDKELPELKSSLAAIQKTSDRLIDDIDREVFNLTNSLQMDSEKIADEMPTPSLTNLSHHRR